MPDSLISFPCMVCHSPVLTVVQIISGGSINAGCRHHDCISFKTDLTETGPESQAGGICSVLNQYMRCLQL